MSVKIDPSGRRSIELEVEVPGTPEQVWRAIATGPGISSWFCATTVEERVGGAIAFDFGSIGTSTGVVTAWEPPYRIAYEEPAWVPEGPPVATEFVVEARSGGTCVVRLVNSLFASNERWDDQLESFEAGWPPFFHVLRLVLTHFEGRPCVAVRETGSAAGTVSEVWDHLTRSLGLVNASLGERRRAPVGAPTLAGTVERVGKTTGGNDLVLRLDDPGPGVALLFAFAFGGPIHTSISLSLFGEDAPAVAERDASQWKEWMSERFPAAAPKDAAVVA